MQKTCCQCNGCPKVAFPEDIMNYIKECLARPYSESYLIPILHRIQNHYGYLKTEYLDEVSNLMSIPTSKISGVATFYSLFTFTPKGEKRISICLGTACYVKGSGKILARLEELLGIKEGGVTKDGKFSIETARCVGACAMAPVVIVNEKVYGQVTPDNVIDILKEHGHQA
jgi:NADH:ubiquinone oxidoreductase subunit E